MMGDQARETVGDSKQTMETSTISNSPGGQGIIVCGVSASGKSIAAAKLAASLETKDSITVVGLEHSREIYEEYLPGAKLVSSQDLWKKEMSKHENAADPPKLISVFDECPHWLPFNRLGVDVASKGRTVIICTQEYRNKLKKGLSEWIPSRILFTHGLSVEHFVDTRQDLCGQSTPPTQKEAREVCSRWDLISFEPLVQRWSVVKLQK